METIHYVLRVHIQILLMRFQPRWRKISRKISSVQHHINRITGCDLHCNRLIGSRFYFLKQHHALSRCDRFGLRHSILKIIHFLPLRSVCVAITLNGLCRQQL